MKADNEAMDLPGTALTHDGDVGEGAGVAEAEDRTVSTHALRITGLARYSPGQLGDELFSFTGGRHLVCATFVGA